MHVHVDVATQVPNIRAITTPKNYYSMANEWLNNNVHSDQIVHAAQVHQYFFTHKTHTTFSLKT